ncbi:hypothetical protein B0J13DRAFT_530627 [Dactylonectria estremocensis]|uniref:Uncharacterized protein n=1 Tax=Dactylonectria estremocensis TaxID=1079267 RepID=A0A9P9DX52_9HYPO|nr:hypothetical protein B0J13DRAFT_530627 [Dactylonectria estremocensis]
MLLSLLPLFIRIRIRIRRPRYANAHDTHTPPNRIRPTDRPTDRSRIPPPSTMVDFLWPGWGPLCTILTAIGLPFVISSTVLMYLHLYHPSVLPSSPSSIAAERTAVATEAAVPRLPTAAEAIAEQTAAEQTENDQRRLREVTRQAVSLLKATIATERQVSKATRIRHQELLIVHRATCDVIHDLKTALQLDGLETDREILSLTRDLADLWIN